MVLLSITVMLAPVLALIIFWGFKTNFPSTDTKALLFAFLPGFLLTIPVKYLQNILYPAGISKLSSEPIKTQLIFSFLIIALIEEGCKFLLLRYYLLKRPASRNSIQSLPIALLMAMGFAAAENFQIAYQNGLSSYSQLMLLSVLSHAAFSIIMAYFLNVKKGSIGTIIAFMVPSILHGLFIFSLLLKANPENTGTIYKGLYFGSVFIIYLMGAFLFYRITRKK